MAQVRFYAMRLDWRTITHYYHDVADFAGFILQPITEDSTKWRDSFILVAYAVNSKGNVIDVQIPLEPDETHRPPGNKKIEFGNIPFIYAKIKNFIDDANSANFKCLYFYPKNYGNYVGYHVTPELIRMDSDIKLLVAEDLQPSPPANAS